MTASSLRSLQQLIAGCFHQDWTLEAASTADAVRLFVEREPAEVVAAALAELDLLLSVGLSEAELGTLLLDEWGSSYDPRFVGHSLRAWLDDIRGTLKTQGSE